MVVQGKLVQELSEEEIVRIVHELRGCLKKKVQTTDEEIHRIREEVYAEYRKERGWD